MVITNTVLPLRYKRAKSPWSVLEYSFNNYYSYHTYTAACGVFHHLGVTMSITSSTLFATKAQQTIENMPGMVKESGIARQQAYGKNCTWDAGVDQDEQFVKSEITWEGERCVKIVLNKGNICWYLLETIACEELKEEPEDEADNEVEDWDEAERGGNRKRIKIRAVSREMAEHEHRYGDVDMEAM